MVSCPPCRGHTSRQMPSVPSELLSVGLKGEAAPTPLMERTRTRILVPQIPSLPSHTRTFVPSGGRRMEGFRTSNSVPLSFWKLANAAVRPCRHPGPLSVVMSNL